MENIKVFINGKPLPKENIKYFPPGTPADLLPQPIKGKIYKPTQKQNTLKTLFTAFLQNRYMMKKTKQQILVLLVEYFLKFLSFYSYYDFLKLHLSETEQILKFLFDVFQLLPDLTFFNAYGFFAGCLTTLFFFYLKTHETRKPKISILEKIKGGRKTA